MNRRKEKLLLFGCICFLSGIVIQRRMEMYGCIKHSSYENREYIPFRAVYVSSEPHWVKVSYKPVRASVIWELFQTHGDSFKELLKYIKEKKEYGPYNVYYQYSLDEDAASWKTEKRIYEYVYEYNGRFGTGKYIEDILFYQDYHGFSIDQRDLEYLMYNNDWNVYDIGRVQWALVHYIAPEVLVVGERPVDEFADFLLEQHFLSDPETELKIIVKNIETEEEPMLIIVLGNEYVEGSFLESYLFYHPNMPKDVKTYYNGKADERHELTLIELEPGWYFFSRCYEIDLDKIVY